MNREKLIGELELIPDDRLAEVYDFLHYFRLGLEQNSLSNPTMSYAGAWSDMPQDELDSFLSEVSARRHQAFQRRRDRAQDAS